MPIFKNKATSGPRFERDLPTPGQHALQLYSCATPNGQKVTILLEELGVPYDAHQIDIANGEQFSSGFVEINPNEKIPALVDREGPNGQSHSLFESGAILLYLAEKYPDAKLIPSDPVERSVCLQWLFWQVGSAPYIGQFGHFTRYSDERVPYAIERYTTETKRLLDVLDKQLARNKYVSGDHYTIADIAILPWIIVMKNGYNAEETLQLQSYKNVQRWKNECMQRPAVTVGLKVNSFKLPDFKNYSSSGRRA